MQATANPQTAISLTETATITTGTLHLVATEEQQQQQQQQRSVQWDDSVVDNEGCGKKSSKVCCIFHKARRFDESDSSCSDSDSEDDGPNAYEREPKRVHKLRAKKKQVDDPKPAEPLQQGPSA